MEETKEKKTFSEFVGGFGTDASGAIGPIDYEKRVMDMFPTKDKLVPHLQRYMQHCVARKVEPTLDVVLDWLYGDKGVLDRDDFVSISRCREMVNEGNVFPGIISDVLEYAEAVEAAAKRVLEDMCGVEGVSSLEMLRDAVARKYEKRGKETGSDGENA